MKRHKNLYEKICDIHNIRAAITNAAKGKHRRKAVQKVLENPEFYARQIQKRLLGQKRLLEKTHTKILHENKGHRSAQADVSLENNGKIRTLTIAPFFPNHIIERAIANIIEPLLLQSLSTQTCAGIKGRGVDYGIKRAKTYIKSYKYYLQVDIKKFYANIDLGILHKMLARKIACKKTLTLLQSVLAPQNTNALESTHTAHAARTTRTKNHPTPHTQNHTHAQNTSNATHTTARAEGLKLGSYLSTILGNFYLYQADTPPHTAQTHAQNTHATPTKSTNTTPHTPRKKRVKILRYADDIVCFSDEKPRLWSYLHYLQTLCRDLRLELHKIRLSPRESGLDFLGVKLFRNFTRVRKKTAHKIRKLTNLTHITHKRFSRIFSYYGFIHRANCFNLFSKVFNTLKPKLKAYCKKHGKSYPLAKMCFYRREPRLFMP